MQQSKLGRSCQLHITKTWKALHFIMRILKKGNNNTKPLAFMALLRLILEYGAVCLDPHRRSGKHFKLGAKESG